MRLGTLVCGNLPPGGRGMYANGESAYELELLRRFDFVALNVRRGDAVTLARELIARGVTVWFYDYGSGWEPGDDFTATIARYEALCDTTGAAGGIVDVEGGWSAGLAATDGARLAAAVKASIAKGYRWGVTSYPEGLAWARELAKVGAWGSPQMYGQTGASAGWYARWATAFGDHMLAPSVALWPGNPNLGMPDFSDPRNYATYLATLPTALGAIGWTQGAPSAAMLSAYLAWEPWHGVLQRVLLWLWSHVQTPVGLAVVAIIGALFLFALLS